MKQIPYSLSLSPSFPPSLFSTIPCPPKTATAFATLSWYRKTSTEDPRTQAELELATEPQTARAPGLGERWPVHRVGTRELPPWVWRAVADRDDWTCKICHATEPASGWEVDHIVPWSTGGNDRTPNLRLTCAACNQRRSNYVDPFARPMPPVVHRCADYDEPCPTRVWCALHHRWESAPAEYASNHELARFIARRELTENGLSAIAAARAAIRPTKGIA